MTGTEAFRNKDQQQTLKPQMQLRGCIDDAQIVYEDAGKLGLPQATEAKPRGCFEK